MVDGGAGLPTCVVPAVPRGARPPGPLCPGDDRRTRRADGRPRRGLSVRPRGEGGAVVRRGPTREVRRPQGRSRVSPRRARGESSTPPPVPANRRLAGRPDACRRREKRENVVGGSSRERPSVPRTTTSLFRTGLSRARDRGVVESSRRLKRGETFLFFRLVALPDVNFRSERRL